MPDKPTPKENADAMLAGIAKWQEILDADSQKVAAEIEGVRQRYAEKIRQAEAAIAALEKALEKLVKQYEPEIMADGDRTELPSGSVMLKREKRVKRIKGMLAKLKKARLTSAIKAPKEYVNWDVVEKFNDAVLKKLGTERVEKAIVSYEIRGK